MAGAYGIENAGDDLPLLVLGEQLRALHPSTVFDFSVLSRHPNAWEEKAYGVRMMKNVEYDSRQEAHGKWFHGLNPGDDTTQFFAIGEEIKNANVVVLGAGNWILDKTFGLLRGPISLLALYVFLAKVHHRPVFLYGLGAHFLQNPWAKEIVRWILEQADVITVRDPDSLEVLKDLLRSPKEIHCLPDPVFGAIPSSEARAREILAQEGIMPTCNKKLMAVGLRDLSVVLAGAQVHEAWLELSLAFKALKERFEFLFLPQSTYRFDDDRETARKFMEHLDPSIHCYLLKGRYHPKDLMALYGLCHFTLAIRLHALVFSLIHGVPAVGIAYMPKVSSLMRMMGLEDFVAPLQDLRHERLISKIENALSYFQKDEVENRKKILECRQKVRQYATLLDGVLQRASDT